jgi:hypothetical protein
MVWELEGPIPILKISKTLKLMRATICQPLTAYDTPQRHSPLQQRRL